MGYKILFISFKVEIDLPAFSDKTDMDEHICLLHIVNHVFTILAENRI